MPCIRRANGDLFIYLYLVNGEAWSRCLSSSISGLRFFIQHCSCLHAPFFAECYCGFVKREGGLMVRARQSAPGFGEQVQVRGLYL